MLTRAERLMLWNQYEILKTLSTNKYDQKSYEEKQEIVAKGYEQFYGDLHVGIDDDTVSRAETSEVIQILDMFRAIQSACEKHKYTPKSPYTKFDGFDGNNDHPQFGIAQFLRKVQGKWAEQKDRPANSHSPMSLPRYRAMLERWKALGDGRYELTPDDVEAISG
ncbi:YfbU family protein [Hyphomicrobium sp. DY-1]|uniref:YfbU family protein n=1 Tax=Hyphomicrobium sp. DY-1 TaxID=3075650 RepID=UPI0039C20738